MRAEDLIRIARTWLGVPFVHQGRNRQGVDCGGLLLAIGEEAGLDVVPAGTYSRSPDPAVLESALSGNCTRLRLPDVQPGDVLWMSFAGEPRHVALVTDCGILHAWAKPGKVVEHRLDAVWRRRIHSAWRPMGIDP